MKKMHPLNIHKQRFFSTKEGCNLTNWNLHSLYHHHHFFLADSSLKLLRSDLSFENRSGGIFFVYNWDKVPSKKIWRPIKVWQCRHLSIIIVAQLLSALIKTFLKIRKFYVFPRWSKCAVNSKSLNLIQRHFSRRSPGFLEFLLANPLKGWNISIQKQTPGRENTAEQYEM